MKTRNFIAVLVLMLGAFSMVIGQKTYYKVDKVEAYILDNVTKQPNLTNVSNQTNVISLDTDNRKIKLFLPDTDSYFTLNLGESTLDKKNDGTPYVAIDAYDNEKSRYFRIFYTQDSITLSYNNDSQIVMIVYYTKEI